MAVVGSSLFGSQSVVWSVRENLLDIVLWGKLRAGAVTEKLSFLHFPLVLSPDNFFSSFTNYSIAFLSTMVYHTEHIFQVYLISAWEWCI